MATEIPFALDEQFVILRRIKAGGFGIVYAGWDEELNLPVALKEIHPELLNQKAALAAFQVEAQLIARLDHPGICRLYTLRRTPDGRLFMILEFIEGGDLRQLQQWLRERDRNLSPMAILYIIRQVGEALHYAHDLTDPTTGAPLHLVHRDIAPSNFMISRRGAVKLIDFGIARVRGMLRPETMGGIIKGRPQYMSPEQIHSPDKIDRRSDIYSLAVSLTEMLAGHSPYGESSNEYELLERVRAGRFDLAAFLRENRIAPELHAPLKAALSLKPQDRTASTKKFLAELEPFAHAIGYNDNRARAELEEAASEAFPAANLSIDLEKFRAARERGEAVTLEIPRGKAFKEEQAQVLQPPSPPRKKKLPALVLAVAGVCLALLAIFLLTRPPTSEKMSGAPSVEKAKSTSSAARDQPMQSAPKETVVVVESRPIEKPLVPPKTTGQMEIVSQAQAKLFIDGIEAGTLLPGEVFRNEKKVGSYAVLLKSSVRPGEPPLVRAYRVQVPTERPLEVDFATAVVRLLGPLPSGARATLASLDPTIRLEAGGDRLELLIERTMLAGVYAIQLEGQSDTRTQITFEKGRSYRIKFENNAFSLLPG